MNVYFPHIISNDIHFISVNKPIPDKLTAVASRWAELNGTDNLKIYFQIFLLLLFLLLVAMFSFPSTLCLARQDACSTLNRIRYVYII